jgi:hypothetical protein
MAKATTVSDYIAKTPPVARRALKQFRSASKAAAPGITERRTAGAVWQPCARSSSALR